MEPARVAIVGLGTVGSGVAKILLEHHDRIARHAGRPIELARVVVRDQHKPRSVEIPNYCVTDRLDDLLADSSIELVAQLIGGIEPARTIMLSLLESGKDVVTANKALIAEHGEELFARARELGRSIAFEASVAGGIPIIANISQCLTANQTVSLRGILNGTSNFIVSQMEEFGADYGGALAEAQRRGFAEADPTMDVDGSDAAQKLSILAHLAFGAHADWSAIPREGIQSLARTDLDCAGELGYRIRLLAVAQQIENELELHVSPTLIHTGRPLAEVRGAFNAISVVGDAVGPVFFHGLGAGQMPTASAVVADLIDVAVGRAAITFRTLELWSGRKPRVGLSNPGSERSRYYLRFHVLDRPGVLADMATVLGRHGISIATMLQKDLSGEEAIEDHSTREVSLVMMTHSATAKAVDRAIGDIEALPSIKGRAVRMRVLD